MVKCMGIAALTMLVGFSTPAQAARMDGDAVIGGAIGAAAGAAVGSIIGGRDGAIVGGGLGGVVGVAAATSDRDEKRVVRERVVRERVVVVRDDDRPRHYRHYHRDNGRHLGHYRHRDDDRCDRERYAYERYERRDGYGRRSYYYD